MPTVALTDRTIPYLKPAPGKQEIYVDRTLKGFGVRVSGAGRMTFVLTYGANRQRIKLGEVGVVKLTDAREQARNILAERQLGIRQALGTESYGRAPRELPGDRQDQEQRAYCPRLHETAYPTRF
jgi:hypothetical protein